MTDLSPADAARLAIQERQEWTDEADEWRGTIIESETVKTLAAHFGEAFDGGVIAGRREQQAVLDAVQAELARLRAPTDDVFLSAAIAVGSQEVANHLNAIARFKDDKLLGASIKDFVEDAQQIGVPQSLIDRALAGEDNWAVRKSGVPIGDAMEEATALSERLRTLLPNGWHEDYDEAVAQEIATVIAAAEVRARQAERDTPIPMILYCPACGHQHIDAPEPEIGWANPPHRSHICHGCGVIWRPADVPTVGVISIATHGKADTFDGRSITRQTGVREGVEMAKKAIEPLWEDEQGNLQAAWLASNCPEPEVPDYVEGMLVGEPATFQRTRRGDE